MEIPIIIEGLQCSVRCGVTASERRQPQPILIDIELRSSNAQAAQSDDLTDTIDYGAIVHRVTKIASTSTFSLLESLAEYLSQTLLQEFPIHHLSLWIRKTAPPLENFRGSVGVRLSRSRSQLNHQHVNTQKIPEPSPFLCEQYPKLSRGKILDLATGHGRNGLFLASRGFSVVGIDRNEQALAHAERLASELREGQFTTYNVDLEANPETPPDLGKEEYEGILVFFYLFRPLFPKIIQALKPGGVLIYETFSIDNHVVRNHPRNPDFCLGHNELLTLADHLRILYYQEGEHHNPLERESAFTARMVAQKE